MHQKGIQVGLWELGKQFTTLIVTGLYAKQLCSCALIHSPDCLFSGYKAPEYASRGIYSVKTDVFSFGVLALAVISGRKNIILEHQGDTVGNLVRDVSDSASQNAEYLLSFILSIFISKPGIHM